VRRVLHVADLHFRPLPRPGRSKKRPFPEWADYTPNSIWIFDTLCRRRHNVSYADLRTMPTLAVLTLASAVSGAEWSA